MANRSNSAGVSMLVDVFVDRYLCDNGFFRTQSLFRAEVSFISQPQVPNGLMPLDYILEEYFLLKNQKVAMDQEKIRLQQQNMLINAYYIFSPFAQRTLIPSLAPPSIPTTAHSMIPSAAIPVIPSSVLPKISSAATPKISSAAIQPPATIPAISSAVAPKISSAAIPAISSVAIPKISSATILASSTAAIPEIGVVGATSQRNNFGVSSSGCNVENTVNDNQSVSLPGNKRVDNFQAPQNDDHNAKKRKTPEVSSVGTPSLSRKGIKHIPRPKKRPIDYLRFDSPPKRHMLKDNCVAKRDQVKGSLNFDNSEARKQLEPLKKHMSKENCVAKKDQVKGSFNFDNTEVRKNLEPPETVDLVSPFSTGCECDDLDTLLQDFGPDDMLEPSQFLLSQYNMETDSGSWSPESTNENLEPHKKA